MPDSSDNAEGNNERLTVVKMIPQHAACLDLQKEQRWILSHIAKEKLGNDLVDAGPAFTMITGEGKVLGCAGVWVLEEHRAHAWALISDTIGVDFLHFHKHVAAFLDLCDYQRIEMAIDPEFKQSIRWAEMLGFQKEADMRKYFPNGLDALLYAKVS